MVFHGTVFSVKAIIFSGADNEAPNILIGILVEGSLWWPSSPWKPRLLPYRSISMCSQEGSCRGVRGECDTIMC